MTDDIIKEVEREGNDEFLQSKVNRSNLKFAAYGCKFLINYKNNLIKYIMRINEMQFDKDKDEDKVS